MSASKKKGTAWESAIVAFLRANGVPHAERRALGGTLDRGDIAGVPGVAIEAKSANGLRLAQWVDEAESERINDGAELAAVWAKRVGRRSPGSGYVVLTGEGFVSLLRAAGYIPAQPAVAAVTSPPAAGEASGHGDRPAPLSEAAKGDLQWT